jgi:hypothetical protein
MLTKVLVVLAVAALLSLAACSSEAPEAPGGADGNSAGSAGTVDAGGAGEDGGAAASDGGRDADGTPDGQDGDDDELIVPVGLDVTLEPGGAGVLDLYALTLREGPDGLELYAALRNDGDVPACDAALKVQLFDTSGQPLGDYINGLYTKSFYLYTLPDGSTTIAACASPGDVTMTAIAITSSDIALSDVGSVVYYYSYFALDAVPIDGLTISAVNTVTTSAGLSYSGTVINELDMMVSDPAVAVFPLNRVGRPLGIASGSDASQIPPGASWTFQTSSVDTPGVDYAAYPSASFSN